MKIMCAYRIGGRSRPRYRSPSFGLHLWLAQLRRYAGSAAMLLVLTACGGGSGSPERYTLTPSTVETMCRSAASLKVFEPDPAPGLDGWRIVVIDKPNHMTRYKDVAWASNATSLVQHYIASSLDQSGLFAGVSTDSDTLPGDYGLESKLGNFEVDLTGEPVVRIRLSATLTRGQENRTVATIRLNRQAPINGADMQGIVAIFNEQMHSLTGELAAVLARKTGCRT